MKNRLVRSRITLTAAAGLSLALMSPAWADCCSSILGCAATYVTDGLSCEVETLIDTLNAITTGITNFIHDVDGQTQTALQTSIQSVNDTYNQMQSQSQQSDADLAAALSQAKALYQQETAIKVDAAHSFAPQQTQLATSASGTTASQRPPVEARDGTPQTTSTSLPLAMTAQANPNLVPAGGVPNDPLSQRGAVDAGVQAGVGPALVRTPPGTFADAFSRAIQQIETLKGAGDADYAKVNVYLQKAHDSETSGVAAANQVQNFMNAPLTVMQSEVSDMLSHPWTAFDPSSVVDSIEDKITSDLTANVNQMIGDITTDADSDFNAAQPNYDDLLANAQAAQLLATTMADAYQKRTPAAADALYAALPQRHFQGMDSKGIAGSALAANNNATKFGQRVPYSVIAARMSTTQQHARLAYKKPNIDQIHLAIVRFKAQRAQGKTLPQPMLAVYKSRLAQQLDSQFNGKSPAAILSERDQLVAQARTQYARDPNTAAAVVGFLNSEATKRAGVVGAATTNPAVPGQPVATKDVSRTAAVSNPPVGLTAPASSFNQNSAGSGFGSSTSLGAAPAALGSRTLSTAAPAAQTSWTQPTATTARPVVAGAPFANPTVPGQPVSAVAPTALQAPVTAPTGQARSSVWGTAPPQNWAPPTMPAAPAVTTGSPVQQHSQIQFAPQTTP